MPSAVSIRLAPRTLAERLQRSFARAAKWARLHLGSGRGLPSYQRSREELGGVPWRRFEKTDAWFVGSAPGLTSDALPSQAELAAATEQDLLAFSEPALVSEPAADPGLGAELDAAPDLRTPMISRRALAFLGGAGALSMCLALLLGLGHSAPAPTLALAAPPAPVATVAAPVAIVVPPKAAALEGRPSKRKPAHPQLRVHGRRL